jgi:2-methylcitrate dehydratase PrpD
MPVGMLYDSGQAYAGRAYRDAIAAARTLARSGVIYQKRMTLEPPILTEMTARIATQNAIEAEQSPFVVGELIAQSADDDTERDCEPSAGVSNLAQLLAAVRMSSVTSRGRDTREAWLVSSEIVVALTREANFVSSSGGIILFVLGDLVPRLD